MPTKHLETGAFVPLFDHRYFNEDLPCGILVQKGIAELAGVPTPMIAHSKCRIWVAWVNSDYDN